jgi:hypothetical protein
VKLLEAFREPSKDETVRELTTSSRKRVQAVSDE